MARLIYRADNGQDMEVLLGRDEPVAVIGRSKTCAIRTGNNTVSRVHAEVAYADTRYKLRDLGSRNGTFFNGQLVGEYWLEDGDVFQCGAFPVRFELEEYEKAAVDEDALGGDSQILAAEVLDDEEVVDALVEDEHEPIGAEPVDSEPIGAEVVDDEDGDGPIVFRPMDEDVAFRQLPTPAPPAPPTGFDGLPFDGGFAGDAGFPPPTRPPIRPPTGAFDVASPFDDPGPPPPPAAAEALDPNAFPPTVRGTGRATSEFTEFNRQLELKDQRLDEVQTALQASRAEVARLEGRLATVEGELTAARARASSEDHEELRANHDALEVAHEAQRLELQATRDRLNALESQILRITDGQPSEKEMAELLASKDERDRLWEEREEMESRVLELKRTLEQERSGTGDQADKVSNLEEQLEDSHDIISGLQRSLDELEARAGDSSAQEEAIQRLEERTRELETALADARAEQARLERDRDELERAASDTSAVESAQARAKEMEGRVSGLESDVARERDARYGVERDLEDTRRAVRRLEDENAELKQLLAGMPDETAVQTLESERNKARHELDELATERDRLQMDLSRLRADLDAERVDSREREERLRRDLDSARATVDALRTEADQLRNKVTEFDDIIVETVSRSQHDDVKRQLESVENERDSLNARLERETAQVRTLDERMETERARAKGLESELAAATDRLQSLDRSSSVSDRKLQQAEKRIADLQDSTTRLQADLDEARAVRQALDAANAELAEKTRQVDRLSAVEAKLDAALAERRTLEDRLAAAERRADEAGVVAAEVEELREQLEELREEHESVVRTSKGQVRRITSLLEEMTTLREQAGAAKGNDEAERQVAELRERLRAAEDATDALKEQLTQAAAAGRAADAAQEEVAGLQRENARLATALAEAERGGGGDALAAASRLDEQSAAVTSLVEEVNGRISDFKSDLETVTFYVEDIKNGKDPEGNFRDASELLTSCVDNADAIKLALRRFRREQMN